MPSLLPRSIVTLFALSTLVGCAQDPNAKAANETKNVVYICTETQQLIEAPPQETPATHPDTGKPTLLRALYCGECKEWKPVPPSNNFHGNPLTHRCPKHNTQLTATGPTTR